MDALNTSTLLTKPMDMLPRSFIVLRFYDQETCFAWEDEKLALFPYDDESPTVPPIEFLSAPAKIRSIHSYDGRVFVICNSSGVFKLSRTYQFAVLSTTAVGIGAEYYQVLCLKDKYIYLDNKQDRTSRLLLKHCLNSEIYPCIVALNNGDIDAKLKAVLHNNSNDALCIVTNGNDIYKVSPDSIQLIYSYFYSVIDIIPLKKGGKIICLLYVTSKNTVILMYAGNDELIFEKLHLNTMVETLCAGTIEVDEDTIWIMHSDGKKTYNTRKVLGRSSVKRIDLEARNIICLRNHNSKVLGLTREEADLVHLSPIFPDDPNCSKQENFFELKREMLDGTNSIVDAICQKVKELLVLDEELEIEQKAMKRINIFACKQQINTYPKMCVQKIASKSFLTANFGNGLPENTYVILSVTSRNQKIFSTKIVSEALTKIEMPVPKSRLSKSLKLITDLITHEDEENSCCLIKDCIKESGENKEVLKNFKVKFVIAKLAALRNLKLEGKLNVEKFTAIRYSVRKELQNI